MISVDNQCYYYQIQLVKIIPVVLENDSEILFVSINNLRTIVKHLWSLYAQLDQLQKVCFKINAGEVYGLL